LVANAEVAAKLVEIADLLDLLGERFKPEAYRRAARSLEALPEGLEAVASRGALRTIPGVGEAIAAKVEELLRSGTIAYLDRLRSEIPAGVLALMRLPGVGPKTARRFWVELGVHGPEELAAAVAAGRLDGVKGFGERKIAQLREALEAAAHAPTTGRRPLELVWPIAQGLVTGLRAAAPVREVALAGSFRRGRETVGDLDLLVTSDAPEEVFDAFSRLPGVREIRLRGPTKETVVLDGGLQVDLRVVAPEAFGAALQYFTGSKDHNVRLRSRAREHGLKVNEYGVYRGEARIAGRTEEEVYGALGLALIPPELREDRGEIDLAARGPIPRLVDTGDLTEELHLHLPPSAGVAELERVAAAAATLRLRRVGVVTGVWAGGALGPSLPEETLHRLRNGVPPLAPVLEVRGSVEDAAAAAEAAPGSAYRVLAPTALARPASPPRGGVPVRVLAHVGGPAEAAGAIVELARSLGAGIEVGPGPERFDPASARVAVAAGVPLVLPTGVEREAGDALAPVALLFARRAGARPEDVLNARPVGGGTVRPGRSPTGSRSGRRRR